MPKQINSPAEKLEPYLVVRSLKDEWNQQKGY